MKFDAKQLREMSNAARHGAVSAIRSAYSGHLGIALGAADIVTTVYANYLRPGVDRFVLSAGHGSALLYSVLDLAGYAPGDLKTFRKICGLPGHPEYGTNGVESTTGPLGQGIANAVGMALGQKLGAARKMSRGDARVYCLCSDGDLMEGVANEAIALAGRYKLNNLILLWDDNQTSIDGTALTDLNVPDRMAAAGYRVLSVNGHNHDEINFAIATALRAARPVFIQCKTVLGRDSSVAGKSSAHGLAVDDIELAVLESKFKPDAGKKLWAKVARNSTPTKTKIPSIKPGQVIEPSGFEKDISTRELSGKYLEQIISSAKILIGGSADLALNTNTKTKLHQDITHKNFGGNFINFGVREHAMAAIMNGLCLSGFRPYGGTFLVFSDYMRPSIRLSALMGLPAVYVFTHDSVMVGEDGPTHQPIEQIASLRLIPNLNVFRPCNWAEVVNAWENALSENTKPSCIILSRQKFPQIQSVKPDEISRGGYVVYRCPGRPKTTLIATGAEVPLAIEIAKKLKTANVVSMPCVEIFRLQSNEYKNTILVGKVVAIEAGSTNGWYEFADAVIGIDAFGKSGSGADVYKSFGFDAERLSIEITQKLK